MFKGIKKGGDPSEKTEKKESSSPNSSGELVAERLLGTEALGAPLPNNESRRTDSPVIETCPICLDPLLAKTVKTACKHKFHKKCLMEVCDSGMTNCPICRGKISHDCMKLLPGKFMPDYRIAKIISNEIRNRERVVVDDNTANRIIKSIEEILPLLKFPKGFSTSEWSKINFFSEACDASTNLDKVLLQSVRNSSGSEDTF